MCGFVSHLQDAMVSVMFVRSTVGVGSVGLVLVFAATHSEMSLQSVLYNPIQKTKCRNCQIICRNRKKSKCTIPNVIYIDISGYFLINLPQSSLRLNPGQVQNDQTFGISLVSVALKK